MGTSSKPGIHDYSTTPGSNDAAGDVNFAEGQAPNTVNNSNRQVMADNRAWYEEAQWIDLGFAVTRTGNTTFTIAADVTSDFEVGRRVKIYETTPSTWYGTIIDSSFSSPDTTITLLIDSADSLTANLNRVWFGIISSANNSIPTSIPVNKNHVINGNAEHRQRTDNANIITATKTFILDRFHFPIQNTFSAGTLGCRRATTAANRPTPAKAGVYSQAYHDIYAAAGVTVGSTDSLIYTHILDGNVYAPLHGNYYTVSFWFRSKIGGTFSVGLQSGDGTNSYVTSHTSSVDSWEKFSIVVPIDSDDTAYNYSEGSIGLYLHFCLGSGASASVGKASADTSWATASTDICLDSMTNMLASLLDYVWITNVKIERGSVATNWVDYPDTQEYKRYYWRETRSSSVDGELGSGFIDSAGDAVVVIRYPVSMIKTASVSISANPTTRYSAGASSNTSKTISNNGVSSCLLTSANSLTSGEGCTVVLTADGDFIEADSEL